MCLTIQYKMFYLTLLLPLFGHTLADARCQIFVSNSHLNASIGRAEGQTGVIDLWFWAANGTNFSVTYPRKNPANTFTATFQTLKTGWIKTILDWPVGTYWEHMGTLSIPNVNFLKGDTWVKQLTVNLGDKETARMVVSSSDPMIWIRQKSCDITYLDPKIFLGESSCPSYPDVSPAVNSSSVSTTSSTPIAAADTTVTPALTITTTTADVPTAAANINDNICSQKGSSSNSSSIILLTVLLILMSLPLLLLTVYTYRLRNQLGKTGAHVSFQPLKNDGTTMPHSAPNGSQNSLHDVSVPLN